MELRAGLPQLHDREAAGVSFPIPLVVLRQPKSTVTTQELARVFSVSRVTVRHWAEIGVLPPACTHRGDSVHWGHGGSWSHAGRQLWRIGDLVHCYLW